ncbi:MAG: hypothetical protein ACTIJJ_13485 [Galactobacter sp.]
MTKPNPLRSPMRTAGRVFTAIGCVILFVWAIYIIDVVTSERTVGWDIAWIPATAGSALTILGIVMLVAAAQHQYTIDTIVSRLGAEGSKAAADASEKQDPGQADT